MQSEVQITQKVLKRQKGLGKLNRLIASAQAKLKVNGYEMKRFMRDYENGTATSVCKKTGKLVSVNIHGKTEGERFVGEAFNTEVSNATA